MTKRNQNNSNKKEYTGIVYASREVSVTAGSSDEAAKIIMELHRNDYCCATLGYPEVRGVWEGSKALSRKSPVRTLAVEIFIRQNGDNLWGEHPSYSKSD